MKRIKIYIIGLMAVALTLSSCLKDKVGDDWTDALKGQMYAYIIDFGFKATALQPIATPQYFTFKINIGTDALPSSDVTLKLGTNVAAMTAYNTLKGTAYKLYPYVEILTPTVIIKAGTRMSNTITVKVTNANLLNACDNYMAPIAITEASSGVTIAGNGTLLMALPIANPYAGSYRTVGYRIRPGNATEPVDAVQAFNTVDCKTIQKNGFGNYTAFDIKIEVTSTVVVVGGVNCLRVIATPVDATGASVGYMWTTWTGDAALKPADLTINYYNPVTRVFILNCAYTSSAGDRIMYETCTRI
jgi:hypothetical protein